MPLGILIVLTIFLVHGMIADILWLLIESNDPVLNITVYINELKKLNYQ